MAETRCKYYKQKRQVSYDGGQTWQDVIPYQYQRGDLYEYESADCGAVIVYRWVNMDPSTDYYCEGTTKRYKQKKQVSFDGGTTWQDVVPAEYQEGGVAEEQSTDCGYVPGNKLVANYSYGGTLEVECNGSTELTSGETKPREHDQHMMTTAVIGQCVTVIGDHSFEWCDRLTSVAIPNSVTTIGKRAFDTCKVLPSITIPNSVTTIGEYAFCASTGLTSVTIGNSITYIDEGTFLDCSGLTSVVIPNSVVTIGDYAFAECSGLTSVTIGNGITSIGWRAFQDCSSLTSVTCLATTPPTLVSESFFETSQFSIYVPSQSVEAYKSAQYWSRYASRIYPIT